MASAGRPDLLGRTCAPTFAKPQHGLAGLPRNVELLPTQGEGSFCTSSGAGRYTSTIGTEVDANPLPAIDDAEAFA